jgi:chromosome partitioning protein
MITIAVANQKGGVGKTTISFNLTHELAKKRGVNILAIDNDSQAHLTGALLENPHELSANIVHAYEDQPITPHPVNGSIHLIGADDRLARITDGDLDTLFLLREALDNLNGKTNEAEFDYAIIDCLPSSSFVQMAALAAADYVLIPVKPSGFDLRGMVSFMNNINKIKKRLNPNLEILGIVINQADGRKPIYEKEMEEALRDNYKDLVFKTTINKRVNIATSPAFNKPITTYDPKSPSANEFKALTKEIMKKIKEAQK